MFSKTLSLEIARPDLLTSESISKFYIWKAKATTKTEQLIKTYRELIFNLTFGLNFHRQKL